MSAISGKDGDVIKDGIQVCETTKWSVTLKSNNPAYASNCSSGAKRRRAGVTDASGTIEGKYDPGRPMYGTGVGQIKEGAEVVLYLYFDDYQYIDAPIVIDDVKFDTDMDTGEIISFTANFSQRESFTINNAEESSASSSSSSSTS